ncbi:MAG: CbiX/SirB N-terminal domain-containing protein [Rhodoferax sp.]|uniref:sirohydrochlorin chelatase n=1 Tax=Rhodoferax sp. TaxID=50421 RepID=UPI00262B4A7F|nr:CbiX/SirB N-terminal domain-containing protein [Rhodoferax sp.]MDD2882735.1 CbiX/SirB N-terminal domain-containing protein [Rhodoferax sp.]
MHATILFGHGSRDPAWRKPIDSVAESMRELKPQCVVRCAFLELTQPDLASVTADLVATEVKHITIVPMFLGVGRHAREDLPVLVTALQQTYPAVNFILRPSVGEDPRVVAMLARLSLPDAEVSVAQG